MRHPPVLGLSLHTDAKDNPFPNPSPCSSVLLCVSCSSSTDALLDVMYCFTTGPLLNLLSSLGPFVTAPLVFPQSIVSALSAMCGLKLSGGSRNSLQAVAPWMQQIIVSVQSADCAC